VPCQSRVSSTWLISLTVDTSTLDGSARSVGRATAVCVAETRTWTGTQTTTLREASPPSLNDSRRNLARNQQTSVVSRRRHDRSKTEDQVRSTIITPNSWFAIFKMSRRSIVTPFEKDIYGYLIKYAGLQLIYTPNVYNIWWSLLKKR